jgi:hypothetical protein
LNDTLNTNKNVAVFIVTAHWLECSAATWPVLLLPAAAGRGPECALLAVLHIVIERKVINVFINHCNCLDVVHNELNKASISPANNVHAWSS